MNINDRVRMIRNHLNMTQTDFGEKVAITQNHLSGVEVGRREVSERLLKLICNEFNVNEEWLRTGEGEMFLKLSDEHEIGKLLATITKRDDEMLQNAMKNLTELSMDDLKIVNRIVESLLEKEKMERLK
ncbi:helix-turn-helix domain-containing protein [Lysinibacillus piscis]|uniref:HTH cro/C1-type domain-containing protein n=1 Tax=Lysinibacillus piscis TaxID=2518931 RepID=A0ABQ5NK21_9BACI|nr:helix-turn-helix transcriptional regulator [Lysinibacillus sp. KH24]GLC88652.1 hypothetical protein LYSBPC_17790 [Lysinibacillus sp. KH24]